MKLHSYLIPADEESKNFNVTGRIEDFYPAAIKLYAFVTGNAVHVTLGGSNPFCRGGRIGLRFFACKWIPDGDVSL